ncbi:MAG: TolC family outer membrane protein [Hyphomicrobiaceae bacterium]|nr:TolC family outer membrane protein [Hyphomicrobiaceae bacterium]
MKLCAAFAALVLAMLAPSTASAETLYGALARAYRTNPSLNAERATTRATDENVPQALAGYRPTITASGEVGVAATRTRTSVGTTNSTITPAGVSLTVRQLLFNGFRTQNGVLLAEARVLAQRASLDNVEQNVLLAAVEAYVGVIRDGAILDLRQRNVAFLEEQVRAARERFEVGEGTRTDTAQAEARLAFAIALVSAARAQSTASRAIYRQIIGVDPQTLSPAELPMRLLPSSQQAALDQALTTHPAIEASRHSVDAATYSVEVAEGALLPTVSLEATAAHSWEPSAGVSARDSLTGYLRFSVPIYQGGAATSAVRQATETLGAARLQLDVAREQVRAAVIAAHGGLVSARAQIESARAQIEAAQLALDGVIAEREVGQRTTLEVLNAQEELLNARITLVSAERDAVVAGYTLVAALGRLSVGELGLQVERYEPEQHYRQVRDQWYGLRTPDGR